MLGYLVVIPSIAFFYKAGDMADDERIGGHKRRNWALVSLGLWLAAFHLLGWGIFMGLALQVVLFVVLTAKESAAGNRSQEEMQANVRAALKRRDRELYGRR